jgi:hypothetical protein
MIAFGWSAGDIASAIKVIVQVAKAFKTSDGAAERYQRTCDFLSSFKTTLKRLETYVEANPNDAYASDIGEQLQRIQNPWGRFVGFVEQYEASLAHGSQKSRFDKARKIVKWTLKDLSGEVEKLQEAIQSPLQLIDPLLSLMIM